MDDLWDLFSPAAAPAAASSRAPASLARASAHPHFTSCLGLWADACGTAETVGLAAAALREFDRASCVAALSSSKGIYGRDAAVALSRAHAAFASFNSARAASQGRAVADLCSEQLEEGDWDDPCWQEASLVGLAYQLAHACVLHFHAPLVLCEAPVHATDATAAPRDVGVAESAPPQHGGEAAECGRLAIALFNLAVVAGTSDVKLSAWQPWLGLLLSAAERACSAELSHSASPSHGTAPSLTAYPAATAADRRMSLAAPPAPLAPRLGARPRIASVDHTALSCARFWREHLTPALAVVIRGHLVAEQWVCIVV